MKHVSTFLYYLKQIVHYGVVPYVVIVLFGYTENGFITVATILTLLFIIWKFNQRIDTLESEIKNKEKIIQSISAEIFIKNNTIKFPV